jgi:hypothetical protein
VLWIVDGVASPQVSGHVEPRALSTSVHSAQTTWLSFGGQPVSHPPLRERSPQSVHRVVHRVDVVRDVVMPAIGRAHSPPLMVCISSVT